MKALVTGGTGFIGKYVVSELIRRGTEVTFLTSNLSYRHCEKEKVRIVYTTYEFNDLAEKLPEENYDVFYHLGWAGVGGKDKNNILLQTSNIQVAIDMLRLAKKFGCALFVAAGTVAEYFFGNGTIDFTMKQTPNDVYGATKVAIHYLLEAIAKEIKQDMIWAVLPSTYGEGRKEDNIITYTITTLLKGEKPQYGSLEQMWDFLYVTEVARAIVDIGQKGKHNTTYGIGSGRYRPLKEYIYVIRNMIDSNLPLGINERVVEDETFCSCVNIEQLTADTGFVPCVSFEEGIERTILYYKKQMSSFSRKN